MALLRIFSNQKPWKDIWKNDSVVDKIDVKAEDEVLRIDDSNAVPSRA